jgi:hypothetical protein
MSKKLNDWKVEYVPLAEDEKLEWAVVHYVGGEDPYLTAGYFTERGFALEFAHNLNTSDIEITWESNEGNPYYIISDEGSVLSEEL